MWTVRGNIDVVQLNIGINNPEAFFLESVDFRGKKINSITIVSDYSYLGVTSPFDNSQLITAAELKNLYVDLYDKDGNIIDQNVEAENFSPYFSRKINIDRELNLKLSCLRYTGYLSNLCVLVYVSYSNKDSEVEEYPINSVAVNVNVSGNSSVKLSQYITDYFANSKKRIKAIETITNVPFYLDIKTFNNRVFRLVNSTLFDFGSASGKHTQPFLVDDLDIDFRNSTIINPVAVELQCSITFYY